MFKSRIREKSKLNNKKFLLALCVCIVFLGTAYSSMSQVLTLTGVATIKGRGSGSSGGVDSGEGSILMKGNLEAYISETGGMWRAGTEWNLSTKIIINNQNDFDTTNCEVIIYAPGITGITLYNGAQVAVDDASDTAIITMENSATGVIKSGDSYTLDIVIRFTNELFESIIDTFSPEELELITDNDRSILYGSAQGDLSANLKNALLEHIVYNLAGTPTPNNVEVSASTVYEPEYNLTDFTYTYGEVKFDVTYSYYVRYDGVYITTAKISATNISDYDISNLAFTMKYNYPLRSDYYNSVVSNWGTDGQNKFDNMSSINIVSKTEEEVLLETPSWNPVELTPGQTRNYYITQIITPLKFKSFTFTDISYDISGGTAASIEFDVLEDDEEFTDIEYSEVPDNTAKDSTNTVPDTGTNGDVQNKVEDNIVEKPSDDIVDDGKTDSTDNVEDGVNNENTNVDNGLVVENPLTTSVSFVEQDWGRKVLIATVTLSNSTEKEIKSATFDLVYDVPVETQIDSKAVYSSASLVSQTNEKISLTTASGTVIPAGGSITFTINGIDGSTGTSALTLSNVVCTY